jgi:hypothetical protein
MVPTSTRRWPLGACGLALAALVAAGGAAARPGGVLLGIPPVGEALVAVATVALLAAWVRGRRALAPLAGLLVPVVLVLSGLPAAGVRAVSGQPLLALVLAGAVVAAAELGLRPPRLAFLPAVFLLYVVVAGRVQVEVGPRGDEPHYLMVADSLLHDHDLSLEKDYAERRYDLFHDTPLAPHYRVRGRHGEIYSLHAVGLSVLILPAYAAAGYVGASVFLAFVAALLALEMRDWVRELTGRDGLAEGVGWALALTPPLIHYAGLVFSEVPAALLVAVGLRRARAPGASLGRALAVGLAAAALPWLNVRYAPLAVIVLAHALWHQRRPRSAAAILVPALVSAAGVALYHQVLYGFLDPRRVYGRHPELALANLREGLPGLLFDQEFGLLVYAPVLALALPGLVLLWRRWRPTALAAIALVVVVVGTAGSWPMWRGGFNPPGRFLVPLLPVLGLAVAAVWDRRGLTAGAALLVGWSLWTGLVGGWEPRLVHRDRDGTAPFFRECSGALEWTGLLPGYVLSDPGRDRLALVWGAALLLALPWRTRPRGALRLAVAGLGWIAAAQAAAGLASARTGDRDAVRVVGRPALSVPGFSTVASAEGVWTTAGLGWGPLYEPYRHPSGAELGRRLPLAPGRYELALEAENPAPEEPAPLLDVVPDAPGSPARPSALEAGRGGFVADFRVEPGERAVTLRLRGGGPLILKEIRLREVAAAIQPHGRALVQ